MKDYDEQAAIDYIRTKLPAQESKDIDDDEILNVIDMIWDYYEDNGFLNVDLDEDGPDDLDVEDLLKHVKKLVAKDQQSPLTFSEVEAIVRAELDYEDQLENN